MGIYEIWKTSEISELSSDSNIISFAHRHSANVYGFFAHSSSIWGTMDSGLSDDGRRKFWKAGIQIITENMPTGRMFEVELTYGGGNKDRALIVIELTGIRPDYGPDDRLQPREAHQLPAVDDHSCRTSAGM